MDGLQGPLQFHMGDLLTNWKGHDLTGLTKEQFLTAFNLVTFTLDVGYFSVRSAPPVGAQVWASLVSTITAAIGRGYACSHSNANEAFLNRLQAAILDPSQNKKDLPFQNMFDQLTATTEHLHTYLAPDNEGAAEWLNVLKEKTRLFTDQFVEQSIREALDEWKVYQIRERANDLEAVI